MEIVLPSDDMSIADRVDYWQRVLYWAGHRSDQPDSAEIRSLAVAELRRLGVDPVEPDQSADDE